MPEGRSLSTLVTVRDRSHHRAMADEAYRVAERRARESGEVADAARVRGPTGTELVREAIESGTPRARLELSDQLRASIGREVQVTRSSKRVHRLVPREVNDEQVRGDVPGEGERVVRLRSVTSIQYPGTSS